jgi:hypothetical protein
VTWLKNPYVRTFALGAIWFAAVAWKLVSRHAGHSYPPRNLVGVLFAWLITALLLGAVAARFERLRSWWILAIGTMAGSLAVVGLMTMALGVNQDPLPAPRTFANPQEMMDFFVSEAAKWVKADQRVDLDYSLESIRLIEEQLNRLSQEVDRTNPAHGTFGQAAGYGAYVGEVFRRQMGGSWSIEHADRSRHPSYPLMLHGNTVIFPVAWCWNRITNGAAANVYEKAKQFAESTGTSNVSTNLKLEK